MIMLKAVNMFECWTPLMISAWRGEVEHCQVVVAHREKRSM